MVEEKKTRRKKRKYTKKQSAPAQPVIQVEQIATAPEKPLVRKHYTKRLVMLALGALGVMVGLVGFIVYYFTMNLILGIPGVLVGFGGAILFKYYWDKTGDLQVEEHGGVQQAQVNCLNIYRDRILFEDWKPEGKTKPEGYIWKCLNDKKPYWLNISPLEYNLAAAKTQLSPLQLPDQQYYDPTVFAERVLSLPAHRRMFKRREKAGQVIKTALLVLTIIVLWIVILTTTG